ncbi:MAG TPA: GNAT family N-acetyltransferase [Candidatus Limiplasma sp.]|nr:GNAT family N-acetyltransferase [Candidatus Limiplasma sp.]HRX08476.1 GNAT family N-acetyltransferase [Candidatus Limiplasma sp.]
MGITLEPYTQERCHAFWRGYTSDPAMWSEPFVYDEQKINAYYQHTVTQPNRVYFAVCHQGDTIGEIQLKRINQTKKHATLSVHLADDRYKNQGLGTQAIRLMTDYGFAVLDLEMIYADAVHRNMRSQHVLEKLGFIYTHEDDLLRYYALRKPESGA